MADPTPARDALNKVAYVSTGAVWPIPRRHVDTALNAALGHPASVLAALVEAHGLEEVLRLIHFPEAPQ